jgi:hypothetical protein
MGFLASIILLYIFSFPQQDQYIFYTASTFIFS